MKRKLFLSIMVFWAIILFVGLESIFACTCKSSNSPCATFNKSDAVFIAEAVEEISQTQVLNVIENLKGIETQKVTMNRNSSCDVGFKVGEKYLVFANRDEKTNILRAYSCGGTKFLRYAAKDLEFIRKIIKGQDVSSIYGSVRQRTGKKEPLYNTLGNMKLELYTESVLKGDKYVKPKNAPKPKEIFTDNEGNYQFDDLPKGKHKLKLLLSNDLTTWRDEVEIYTGNQTCSEINYEIQVNGRISGKIVDENGNPAVRQNVRIQSKPYNPYISLPSSTTDVNGNFELKGIPPGSYKIVTSPHNKRLDIGYPFSSYYFPGTLDASKAEIIEIQYAEKIINLNFSLLPIPTEKIINIELIWEDGTPIKPPNVHYNILLNGKAASPNYVNEDKDGIPTLKIYTGLEYQIYAFGQLKDGRLYETDKTTVKAEDDINIVKLKARLRD